MTEEKKKCLLVFTEKVKYQIEVQLNAEELNELKEAYHNEDSNVIDEAIGLYVDKATDAVDSSDPELFDICEQQADGKYHSII